MPFFAAQQYPNADELKCNARWTREAIEALKMKQRRFSAYRAMVFWAFPNIRRKERRPLPSCLYMQIRAQYPPTLDDEEFADHIFTKFIPEVDE